MMQRRLDRGGGVTGSHFAHQLFTLADDRGVPFSLGLADFGRGPAEQVLQRLHVGLHHAQFPVHLAALHLLGG